MKNHIKKHGALSMYKSMIFPSCSSQRKYGSNQTNAYITLLLLREVCKGKTRIFMTEKQHSTPKVDDEISTFILKVFLMQ